MATAEEMMESMYIGMKQMQKVLPQIADALTQLTVINERQSHNTDEHKVMWERIDRNAEEAKILRVDITKLETQQTACLERQKTEETKDSNLELQNRGVRIDMAKMIISALVGAIVVMALMHGPQLLIGMSSPAAELVKPK